jgi:fumarylacetoacetase
MTSTTDLPTTWVDVPAGHQFGISALPYGSFRHAGRSGVGVAIGDLVLDLTGVAGELAAHLAPYVAGPGLDRLLAAGPDVWDAVRSHVTMWLSDDQHRAAVSPFLLPADEVSMRMPFTVADYVDFYASEHHATNLGRMFRPDQEPLTPNWKHLPIGYHGRAGTIVVSDTDVVRPSGQRRSPDGDISFGPSTRLDIEAELGFVVGPPSRQGAPVAKSAFADHVFGVCLVNDWSARDLQAWEYVPLGPFLGKSFATSVSPWVLPLSALEAAWVSPPARTHELLAYLDDTHDAPRGLDIRLEVRINDTVVSRPPYAAMYWTGAQMLAHMTANGASLRTGDFFASGTISGPEPDQRGSLIELTWGGSEPLTLLDGSSRTFLDDGDVVTISATAPGPAGTTIGLGQVCGRIVTGQDD